MSKKVSISKKIAAGLIVGLMLGSSVPAQATFWGSIKSFGSSIKTKVSAINSDVNRFLGRILGPVPSMDHPFYLGLMSVCFMAAGCSIFMGLDILKNAHGLSKFKQYSTSVFLVSVGAYFMSRAKDIYKDRRNFIQKTRVECDKTGSRKRENTWIFAVKLEPSVTKTYELADVNDEIGCDGNGCV